MAAITTIVHNLLLLYGHTPSRDLARRINTPLPDTAPLDAIAYILHQSGVSSIKLYVGTQDITELNHPFLLLRTNETGTNETLHYNAGKAHLLTPALQETTHISEWISDGQLVSILAFDGEALKAATLPAPIPSNKAHTLLQGGAILLLMVVLGVWVWRISTMPLLNVLLSVVTLLTAFISLILLLKETGLAHKYTRPFCGKTNYLGCNRLITSPLAANKWGISWAAMGLAHAAASIIYVLLIHPSATQQIMYLWLWLLPGIVMMVWLVYKMRVLRTFCKLCLLVHSLNLLAFSIATVLFARSPNDYFRYITVTNLLVFAGVALLAGWLVLALYQLLQHIKKSAAADATITDLRYGLLTNDEAVDETILEQLLQTFQPLPLSTKDPEDEQPSLLLVLSLHCTHCAALLNEFAAGRIDSNEWLTDVLIVVDGNRPAAGTGDMLNKLQENVSTPENCMHILQDWYARQEFIAEDETPVDLHEYSFCIHAGQNPLEQLPGIFIAGKKLPYPLGPDSLDLALFIRKQQLEAQETETTT